ncbi:ribonuclease D [Denitrificimonas sp. JX-1]|uniref:Ribonuclease D n=1 Tax=Denitrificimonas halotolerans TaxID=3098930 RepID=A0ABU5GMH9_9GAMM|nr:ribonuclease D [Denitrificimonas sp. JX-1]MDY7218137.1 ribonuclease D [Denitrificimonas sp. JX-1]
MSIQINWISSDEQLLERCQHWNTLDFIALDTEFIRVDTFYPIAGLLQVSDTEKTYLIDPLLIDNWQPLAEVFGNQRVVKVLHACGEDLEVFALLTGALPEPLFDTQLAAGYLNIGFSMGYSRLVLELLGIELPKGETRSNWLQRPLSDLQVEYAAQDTAYLVEVYRALVQQLSEQKYAWVLEDGAALVAAAQKTTDPYELWRSVKLAWKLSPQQLAVLRILSAWREQQARQRNVPRNRIIRESTLWALAYEQPVSMAHLAKLEDMHPRILRNEGKILLDMISQAKGLPPEEWPDPLPEPLPVEASKILKRLRKVGLDLAKDLNIAPEVMLRKKILEELLRTGYPEGPYHLPDSLQGWRRELMGDALLNCLEGV